MPNPQPTVRTSSVQGAGGDLPHADPPNGYLLRSNGNESHEIWEVTDPVHPMFVAELARMGHTPDGQMHTHNNWWEWRVEKRFRLGGGRRVDAQINVFNLMNANTTTRRIVRSGRTFLKPTIIMPPRIMDFAVTYSF